jgi:hypothetical protein
LYTFNTTGELVAVVELELYATDVIDKLPEVGIIQDSVYGEEVEVPISVVP